MTNCHQLKMLADDRKMRLTDVTSPETLLRLIQSVPSPKAESIKPKPISRNAATTQRKAETKKAYGLNKNSVFRFQGSRRVVAWNNWFIARKARVDLEEKTGKSVVTGENFLPPGKERKSWGSDTPVKYVECRPDP